MNSIKIEDEGNFSASGRLKHKQFKGLNFPLMVKEALAYYKRIGQHYGKFMADDNQLIGQEKASLKMILENMMNHLITIRFYLEKMYLLSNNPSCNNFDEGYAFSMYIDDYDYTITGKLSVKAYDSIKTFRDWYTTLFADKLKKFLDDLKVALGDKQLNKDEVEWLNKRLDGMIHLQLIMHYKLDRARLNN